jgi:LacI family transcriptional regulator
MAIGLLEGLDRHGARVPHEISVIGIDDIELSRRTRPKLTTVATPKAAAGRAAVDMLLQHRGNGVDDRRTTAQVTLQTELVIRDSTGPGPRHGADPGLAAATSGDQRGNAYIKE